MADIIQVAMESALTGRVGLMTPTGTNHGRGTHRPTVQWMPHRVYIRMGFLFGWVFPRRLESTGNSKRRLAPD